MKKFFKPIVLAVFVLSACDSNQTKDVTTMSEQELIEYAKGIHERVITMDTHDDINTSNFTAETNYTDRLSSQVNLPKMVEGGLDVAWFVVYTGQGDLNEEGYAKAYENADDKFKAIHRLTEELARFVAASTTSPGMPCS